MKFLGAIIYVIGFLGVAFIITETNIDFGGNFIGILSVFCWLALTMGIGTVLMKTGGENNNDNNIKS